MEFKKPRETLGAFTYRVSTECLQSVYRVWSDGFIEQGGFKSATNSDEESVSFNKQFSNTNYIVTVGAQSNGYNTGVIVAVKSKSRNSMILFGGAYVDVGINWIASRF